MSETTRSGAWQARLSKAMPWGSSTCSKAARLTPEEPAVIVKGKGCRVWDADGREFIDFRNSLGPVTLGYAFPATNAAIKAQLEDGIIYGHPHTLECEVAEMLIDVLPCAEQARFLKTGGEAMAACMRIARAFTGRDHIVQIGYNGWINTLAPSGQVLPRQKAEGVPPGVPEALSRLHHAAPWNDMGALEKLFADFEGQIAAVAVAADYPRMAEGASFYPRLRALTEKHGSLLIFDEIVTGFRIAMGGAQEYFKVTPDLAVFAKGVANGMPLSVYAGRKECMAVLDKVIVSSTYGGEALSLASAKATINTYRNENVVDHLWAMGERMWTQSNGLFAQYGLPLEWKGFWPCPRIMATDGAPADMLDRFMRAAYANGLSLYNCSYVNFSHQQADIDEALERMGSACKSLK